MRPDPGENVIIRRITASRMQRYINKTVRIVGKVEHVRTAASLIFGYGLIGGCLSRSGRLLSPWWRPTVFLSLFTVETCVLFKYGETRLMFVTENQCFADGICRSSRAGG